jgi:hypothetical protein
MYYLCFPNVYGPNVAAMSTSHKSGIRTLTPGHTSAGYDTDSGADSEFRVTVVATTTAGTIAALRTAAALGANLKAKIRLVTVEATPFQRAADAPPVSADFLQRRMQTLVRASGIRADEVSVDVWLCRDRNEGLRWILPVRSLVVVGGKGRWWCRRERALKKFLAILGHQVIFAELTYGPGVRAWWRGLFTSASPSPESPLSSNQPKAHRNPKRAA